ncbi:MAG TPA: GNAT family N-acetyltransferase [Acidimicrobiales bacterium]|nr:GNAT family N-acetyltransferase [Acidimicrobiales bacterium]
MTIRRASADDAEAVTDVWIRSRRHAVPLIPPVESEPDARAYLLRIVRDGEVWVAEAEGGAAAMMALHDDWIGHLYVDPDFARQGIGTQLVDLAKRLRPGGLQLWAFQSNVPAQRFYEQHGFVAVEWTDGSGNMERAPDVRYVWRP